MVVDIKTGCGSLSEYASLLLERRKNNQVLIVMPFYNNYETIAKHLELLSKQTISDFDIIIVASVVSEEKKLREIIDGGNFKFGIVLVKRKEDTGSAGGYFTGEKYALENGYSAIIIGDDDCLPVEPTLIEKTVLGWKGGALATAPESRFLMDGEISYTSRSIPFYGLLDMSLLKKNGLHYLPMYIGADDWEFAFRTIRGLVIFNVDANVTHPARHTIFANFHRSMLYRINMMLLVVPDRIEDYMYSFAVVCPIYMVFGSRRARAGGFHILKSVLSHRFGKDALMVESAYGEKQPERFDVIISSSKTRGRQGAQPYDYSKIRGGFGKLPGFAKTVAGKVVLLDVVNNFAVLLSMMLAKETWIESTKGTYLIARNSGFVTLVCKFFIFGLVLPVFLAGGIMTYLINWFRKPNTRGYGLG
jgi:glycosyltransferase involved in cell wall biosynthesis